MLIGTLSSFHYNFQMPYQFNMIDMTTVQNIAYKSMIENYAILVLAKNAFVVWFWYELDFNQLV